MNAPQEIQLARVGAGDTVTLEIDGIAVSVPAGTPLLRAAVAAGVMIPKLCDSQELKPFGSCRLCLVEVEGRKGYPSSCTTPAEAGMKVRTQSPQLAKLRRNVMELYISDHPLDCLTCAANGDCELQDMAGVVGLREVRYGTSDANPGENHFTEAAKDESNPYFSYDPAKCIVCNRCVRACEETQGTFALTITGRGFGSRVTAGQGESFMASDCVSCGACVKACPTATLVEKTVIDMGQAERSVATTCAYCGVGCGFRAEVKGNQVVRMVPADEGRANEGHACVKGRFAWGYATHPDRITKPMIRAKISDPWREVSWEEALSAHRARIPPHPAAARHQFHRRHRLQPLHQRRGLPGAEAGARRLRQQQRRYLRPRLPFADRLRAQADPGRVGRHADLQVRRTGRCHRRDRRQSERRASGVRLAPQAPGARRRATDRDRSARHRPGQLAACARRPPPATAARHQRRRAFGHGPCHRQRGPDRRGLRRRTLRGEGFCRMARVRRAAGNSPEALEAASGVPAAAVRAAARLYATGGNAAIYYGLGVTEHSQGSTAVIAIANLAMATGNVGREGVGVNPLRGQNNVQGSCDMGSFPHELPGYRHVSDTATRELFERDWGVQIQSEPGLRIPNMLDAALDGSFMGLYCQGEDPAQSDPDTRHVTAALSAMECVVVQDLFLNETAKYAHVFLPGASFLEKDGTFTNAERRISRVRRVMPPLAGKADWETTLALAKALGYAMHYEHPGQIMDEIARLTPTFAGVSYAKLDIHGSLQWPCNEAAPEGTPTMHVDGFVRGKGRFLITQYVPTDEKITRRFPLLLTTGRVLSQYNVGAQTRRTANTDFYAADLLEIHPHDAEERGIREGDRVAVESRVGRTLLPATVTERVAPGVVYTTFHFPESGANVITTENSDWATNCPEYKVTAVQVSRSGGA